MRIFSFVLALFFFSHNALSYEEASMKISDEGFVQIMQDFFKIPEGWTWGYFTGVAGTPIRYGYAKASGEAVATLVMTHAFTDSAELSFNLIQDFLDKGIDVWYMDWYGQSDSGRAPGTYFIPATQPYYKHVEDLHNFVTNIVKRDHAKPFFTDSISMGGNILLRFLNKYPEVFDFALVTSPMLNILELNKLGMTFGLGYALSMLGTFTGFGNKPIGNVSAFIVNFSFIEYPDLYSSNISHSYSEIVKSRLVKFAYPDIRIDDPSLSWIFYALSSIYITRQNGFFGKINLPVFMATGTGDSIVGVRPQTRACGLMPNCVQYISEGAYHNIWNESAKYFDPWMKARNAFIEEQIKMFKL